MSEQATGELVLEKSIVVKAPVGDAFRLYTEGIATWWPIKTHSSAKDRAETVVFEPEIGGRIFERDVDGAEEVWGTVLEWDPPNRFVHSWHPGRNEATAQRVEMRFRSEGDGTRIDLIHTGWEELGAEAAEVFENYDRGWDYVLGERYVAAVNN